MPSGGLTVFGARKSPWFTVRAGEHVAAEARFELLARWSAYRTDDDEYRVPMNVFLRQARWLAQVCVAHSVSLEWADDARAILLQQREDQEYVRGILNDGRGQVDADERLSRTRHIGGLRDFQLRDLGALLALRNGANFSVPGAGKTTVTYALYDAERVAARVARLLVVSPISAFDAWIEESKYWLSPSPAVQVFDGSVSPSTEVLLVNYQRLASNFDCLANWVANKPTHVVLDEAHRIKRGWSGTWGNACLALAPLAARRDVLTGTPAPNHPSDLEAVLDFVWPGQGRSLLPEGVFDRDPLHDHMREAARRIAPLFVRTNKNEMGLPRPRIVPHLLPLTGIQGEVYKSLRQSYAGEFTASRADVASLLRMGRVVMYLLEAATNPALLASGSAPEDFPSFRHPPLPVREGTELWRLINSYGDYETPPKYSALATILEENRRAGRKTLVWSNFVRNLKALHRELRELQPALIYGGVPSGPCDAEYLTRESELHRFREDPECFVLLANPAAMAEGVSLHRECREAVYMDRSFNAGHYLQSLDRIHRLGLDPSVDTRIHLLMVEATVDHVVQQRLAKKIGWLEAVLEDSGLAEMSLPDEDDIGTPLDPGEDIQALLAHLRGDSPAAADPA